MSLAPIHVRLRVDTRHFVRNIRKATIAVRRFHRAWKQHQRRHPNPNSALLARSRKNRR